MMFGHTPQQPPFPKTIAYDAISYQNSQLTQLTDFMETQMREAAYKQKVYYDQHASPPSFKTGDAVWLALPATNIFGPK